MIYTGDKLKRARTAKSPANRPDVYIPSPDLIEAVNLAWMLGRPLLLMGEPGCGKTRLAEAVAYELHGDQYEDFFFRWYIKSSTKARDGLYQYNALRHLRDSNFSPKEGKDGEKPLSDEEFRKLYISDGELGKAFRKTKDPKCSKNKPPVLLIDEIDKADIDFPNDLLSELDTREFHIREGGYKETVKADYLPFTIITSNREKELPIAFLRRCVFYFIPFPEEEKLREILRANFKEVPKNLVDSGVGMFMEVRKRLNAIFAASEKNVSTSELKDWFTIIRDRSDLPQDLIARLDKAKADLKKNAKSDIPYYQALLKNWDAVFNLLDLEKKKASGS